MATSQPLDTSRHPGSGTWAVLPAYNEEQLIEDVVQAVRRRVDHVVVVDDGSCDQTGLRALRAGAFVVSHPVNLGQGAALGTGIALALRRGADILVTFDSDGQHSPTDIPQLVRVIKSGQADVALGSRFLGHADNMPWHRRLLIKAGVRMTRIMCGLKVTDTHNGLRAFSRRAAASIRISMNRSAHASEILDEVSHHRLSYAEVPTRVSYTRYSLKKGQRTSDGFRVFANYLLSRIIG